MLLAGDVGGTKTLLGLFDADARRPRPIVVRSFPTLDFQDLEAMLAAFLRDAQVPGTASRTIDVACFGVAGPVVADTATLTNVPWTIDASRVGVALGIERVHLLNDLQAMAVGATVLEAAELCVLQDGEALPGGNMAVIAAGTGLGEALLHNVGGRLIPSATEGGHADFAARTEREIRLLRDLTKRFGRAQVEHVLSGSGLVHIHRSLHAHCAASVDLDHIDAPADISTAALSGRAPCCRDTLDLFIEAYGAEAGNLALRSVALGGVFVGGGIAPKILPAITDGRFMRAFRAKAPFEAMLARIPVQLILNAETGLLGAAVFAGGLVT